MRWLVAIPCALWFAAWSHADVTMTDGNASATIDLSRAFAFEADELPCRTMRVGDATALILDVSDESRVRGEQKRWLDEQLAAHDPNRVVVMYNAAAYPAVGNPSDRLNKAVRAAWVPLFEAHRVRYVVEHERSPISKCTLPIRDGSVDLERGVTYIDPGVTQPEASRVTPYPPGAWWIGGRWYLSHSQAGPTPLSIDFGTIGGGWMLDGRHVWKIATSLSPRQATGGSPAWTWVLVVACPVLAAMLVAKAWAAMIRRFAQCKRPSRAIA